MPASSDRMLEKSLLTKSDVIIYDLEDSVPPSTKDKDAARNRLKDFIAVCKYVGAYILNLNNFEGHLDRQASTSGAHSSAVE